MADDEPAEEGLQPEHDVDYTSDEDADPASGDPVAAPAGRPFRDVSLQELLEKFAALQRDFEAFREGGRSRPPTRAGGRASDAGQAGNQVLHRAPGGAGGGANAQPIPGGKPAAPRSSSVPNSGRRNAAAPQSGRRSGAAEQQHAHAPLPPRQPNPPLGGAQAPQAKPRAPSAGAPGPQRQQPAVPLHERRQRSPSPPSQQQRRSSQSNEGSPAGADGGKQPSAGKKKKKKPERPPWRDDFVEVASPWSQELAQEAAAAAAAAGPGDNAAGGWGAGPGRGPSARGQNPQARQQSGRSAAVAAAQSEPGPAARADAAPAPAQPAPAQPPRRRPVSPEVARARAAAVAAAKQLALQQQQLLQQQGVQEQAARGGMLLVIPGNAGPPQPAGAGTAMAQPQAPPGGNARSSPVRTSLIPTSPASVSSSPDDPRRSEQRLRVQPSRIPSYAGLQNQASPPQQQADAERRDVPAAPSAPPGPAPRGPRRPSAGSGGGPDGSSPSGGGARVDRLVVEPVVAASYDGRQSNAGNAPLGEPVDRSATPPSSTAGSQPRRRRLWDLPNGGPNAAAVGASGAGTPAYADGPFAAVSGMGAATAASRDSPPRPPGLAAPAGSPHIARPVGAGGNAAQPPLLLPTPPTSRPPSRPGSRPASRPASRPPSLTGDPPGGPQQGPVSSSLDLFASSGSRLSTPSPRPPYAAAGAPRSPSGGGDHPTDPPLHASPSVPLPAPRRASSNGQGQGPSPRAAVVYASQPGQPNGGGGEAPGGGVARSGPGPPGRDHADYMRKLSALKRPVPQRAAEEQASVASSVSASGVRGSSAGSSRKWMDPGVCDAPLSAAPVDAVGSGVAAARSRVHSAEVYSSSGGLPGGGGGEAGGPGAGVRLPRPSRVHNARRNSDGTGELQVPPVAKAAAADAPLSDPGGIPAEHLPPPLHDGRARALAPLRRPGSGQASAEHSTAPSSPDRPESDRGTGRNAPSVAAPALGSGSGVAAGGAAGPISAEQYIAFAVENPDVAMAAAQAALNANGGRGRSRWNLPPPPEQQQQPLLLGPAAAAPPWSQQQQLQMAQQQQQQLAQPQQHPLAAAMGAAAPLNGVLLPPGQGPPQRPMVGLMGGNNEFRRVSSEGPRGPFGRPPAMLDMPQPGVPPFGHGPGPQGYGGPPGLPPHPGPYGSGGAGEPPGGWHGPGDMVHDGSGRLSAFGPGGPHPGGLQPVRPPLPPGGDGWGGGMGLGPPHMQPPLPPQHMPPPVQAPPPWNGYGYPPNNRSPGTGGGLPVVPGPGLGQGPGFGDPFGPMAGPTGDPYKQPPYRRYSGGLPDGGSGPGPSGGPGPGGPGQGPDLPDYMRVSMSRMVAGWSAPNARHGALSGFNDVWQHRNTSGHGRPPPGYGGSPGGPGQGPLLPPAPGAMGGPGLSASGRVGSPAALDRPDRMAPGEGPYHQYDGPGGGGGGGRETGFEGLSLAEVLASKPKKELPNFKKKGSSGSGMKPLEQ